MIIRPAASLDAPMLAAIEMLTAPEFAVYVFEDLVPGLSAGALMSQVYAGDGLDGWRWSWIAEHEGRALGAACAYPARLLKAPDPADIAGSRLAPLSGFRALTPPEAMHLSRLGVLPAARRMGIGRALLGAAEGAARREGANMLSLFVWEDNAPARALYEGEGFIVAGRVEVPPLARLPRHGTSLLMTRAL